MAEQKKVREPSPIPVARAGGSRAAYAQTIAELEASIEGGRRRNLWVASLALLLAGVAVYLGLVVYFNRNYERFRRISAGRYEFGVEHRPLAASDLNIPLIQRIEQARYKQPVWLQLSGRGESVLIVRAEDGRVLGRRRFNRGDLDPGNVSIKHQNKIGESGNSVVLVYDHDGVAKVVVSHSDGDY